MNHDRRIDQILFKITNNNNSNNNNDNNSNNNNNNNNNNNSNVMGSNKYVRFCSNVI